MTTIHIQQNHITLTNEELARVERALQFAFDRFDHAIREMTVTLVDINGPKGGIDKRCSAQLRLYPRGIIVLRTTGPTIVEAVDELCDKARQVIARRLSKRKSHTKSKLPHPAGEPDWSDTVTERR